MIWRVLRKNISKAQLIGYAIANLVGLAIVMVAIKFYCDVHAMFASNAEESGSSDYIVVSRPVSMLNTFGFGGKTSEGISQEDLDDLKAQPWVKDAGEFVPANFSVTGAIEFQGQGMWTHLFLEAVPDKFVDVESDRWKWDALNPDGQEIPVILSKDYLSLYNFGFAASRRLPQISEGLASQIPFNLYLSGNGHADQFKARIAGFSSRLNTIAVPYDFMQWANKRYSATDDMLPSRVMVELETPGDPAIEKYLSRNGLETADNDTQQGRALYFLKFVTTVVVAVGILISLLALYVLMLSISLLLQKNREKNATLMFLGYSHQQIAGCYCRLIVVVNAIVLVMATAIMLVCSHLWVPVIENLGMTPASPFLAILLGWTGQILAMLIMLAKTPAAVTLAPAP